MRVFRSFRHFFKTFDPLRGTDIKEKTAHRAADTGSSAFCAGQHIIFGNFSGFLRNPGESFGNLRESFGNPGESSGNPKEPSGNPEDLSGILRKAVTGSISCS